MRLNLVDNALTVVYHQPPARGKDGCGTNPPPSLLHKEKNALGRDCAAKLVAILDLSGTTGAIFLCRKIAFFSHSLDCSRRTDLPPHPVSRLPGMPAPPDWQADAAIPDAWKLSR